MHVYRQNLCVHKHTKYIMIITKALNALDFWTFNDVSTFSLHCRCVVTASKLTQRTWSFEPLIYIRKSRADPEILKGVQGIIFFEKGLWGPPTLPTPLKILDPPMIIVCNSNCAKSMLTFHWVSVIIQTYILQYTLSVKQNKKKYSVIFL